MGNLTLSSPTFMPGTHARFARAYALAGSYWFIGQRCSPDSRTGIALQQKNPAIPSTHL